MNSFLKNTTQFKMEKKITRKLSMYSTIQDVCRLNESKWNQIPAFTETFAKFETELAALKKNEGLQAKALDGVVLTRDDLSDAIVARLMILQDALWVYAESINNFALMSRNKVNKTFFTRITLLKFENHLKAVMEDVETYSDVLPNYGIAEEFILDLAIKIDEFKPLVNSVRIAIVGREGLTEKMSELSRELDKILKNKLDRLMKVFTFTEPQFYANYKSARLVYKIQGKRKSNDETGTIPTESDDGL